LEKLYSQNSEQPTDLSKIAIQFEEEAEKLAVDSVTESKQVIMTKVKRLQQAISEVLKKIDPHTEDEVLVNRIMNVLKYVQDNFYEQDKLD
jgi:hypothetical protein